MATIDIFASFEFDKDRDLKDNFYRQAKDHSPHRIRNFSLNEAYPTDEWKDKAKAAIEQCDLVIILIGPDTHNAPGVDTEVGIARSLGKPIFQVKPQRRSYNGVEDIELVPWAMAAHQRKDRRSVPPEQPVTIVPPARQKPGVTMLNAQPPTAGG